MRPVIYIWKKRPEKMTRAAIIIIGSVLFLSIISLMLVQPDERPIVRKPLMDTLPMDTVRVAIETNSTDYFIYRGTPLGFQYELLQNMAHRLDVVLDIKVINDLNKAFACVESGHCDLLANSITVTGERKRKWVFARPFAKSKQVLVQRKPDKWWKMSIWDLQDSMIVDVLGLAGKTVHVVANASFQKRLKTLSEEIGEEIHVVAVPKVTTEQLIARVARGEIDYTIADQHMAMSNQTYYNNIDVSVPVSLAQNLAWVVNDQKKWLLDNVNKWLEEFSQTDSFNYYYRKYYRNPRRVNMIADEYMSIREEGRISQWDSVIQLCADSIGWDWRLLASLIYQESRFNPNVVSWAGAFGLMQLMPFTAKRFGVGRYAPPEEHIWAGGRYILWLDERFSQYVDDPDERKKYMLAAYNIGHGHVEDAIALAERYGRDPKKWENVAGFMKKKTDPVFYRDPVVEHGYCRGDFAVHYVKEIYNRWEHYKNLFPDETAEKPEG